MQDGSDLGDLAAFRISSRRWYMFQNMGMSPSARSGHSMTAFGKNIIVLGGEPSSAPHDPKELSLTYVLDTSKIRYPPSESGPAQNTAGGDRPQSDRPPGRKFSNAAERSAIPVKGGSPSGPGPGPGPGPGAVPGPQYGKGQENPSMARPGTAPATSGPPPTQQPPQPRANGIIQEPPKPKKSQKPPKGPGGPNSIVSSYGVRSVDSPEPSEAPASIVARTMSPRGRTPSEERHPSVKRTKSPPLRRSQDGSRPGSALSRTGSRAARQQGSVSSVDQSHMRGGSVDDTRSTSRNTEILQVDSGIGSSPALSQQNDELLRELEAARSRNAWYASELALARKAGYTPNSSGNQLLDERAADLFGDDDRPLIEALLRMRKELAKVHGSIESQAVIAANKIAEAERQRDSAVNEAIYAKAKLAAHGGDVPTEGGTRDLSATPDADRMGDLNKRLAAALTAQNELTRRAEKLVAEIESERRSRHLAEDTAEAAEKRVAELDAYRQRASSELESLRAELHEAERIAREEAANCAEAVARNKMLEADHRELSGKHATLAESSKEHSTVLQSLHQAVGASSDKASLLERKLDEEKRYREELEQEIAALRIQHGNWSNQLESVTRRLRDAEELGEKHAAEARTHREAVLSGLDKVSNQSLDTTETKDQRVDLLQEQVFAANTLVRKNQEAADIASEKLRRAEERIAGLEAYQEQSSREGLTIRKQLQISMRDSQSMQTDKSELQQQLERHRLESNALEVQLKTLKNLLEERGVSASDRRSRALDSPSFRNFGTPDQARVRELEQQLEMHSRSHEELRHNFEQREEENSREYEAKLANLETDHQAAVKYVRGIEKMLAKMKQELQRTKSAKDELERELVNHRADGSARAGDSAAAANWEAERDALRSEMSEVQESLRTTIAELESQIDALKASLEESENERARLQKESQEMQGHHAQQLNALSERARAELDHMGRENSQLAERAREAEHKVQMFLDQFETSVDNYRRQSHMPSSGPSSGSGSVPPKVNGHHVSHESMSGESMYSSTTTSDPDEDDITEGQLTPSAAQFPQHVSQAGEMKPPAVPGQAGASVQTPQHARDRSSTALDSLAMELEGLRTHWETTNKNYRLSDKFDFERTPTGGPGEGDLGESLASWRRKLDLEEGHERGPEGNHHGGQMD